MSAEILASNKSTFCRSVSLAFSFVLAPVDEVDMIKPQISSYKDRSTNYLFTFFFGGGGGDFLGIVVTLEKVAPIHAHLATLCSR